MSKISNKIGVMIFGPQGSGKGTQAKLLADKFGLFQFDTGGYLRKLLYDPKLRKDKIIQRERKINESGKLNTELWLTKIVTERFEELIRFGQGVVTEGFPRTVFEALGDKKTKGLIDVFEKGYGKKNIFIFILDIPESESIKRIKERFTCSICKALLMRSELIGLGKLKFKICPFCGGKIIHRIDDNKESILVRLKEYRERTTPIFKKLAKRGYKIHKIDGRPMPYKIHEAIVSQISL